MRILLRRPIKRSTASPISGILSYDQAIIPAMQPSVPILAQARGSVLRRTTGPKDGVHNYSETYPCDTCGISATVGRALCVPLHPDLHAKTGARQTSTAQVSKPSAPRGLGLRSVSPAPASLRGAAAAQLEAPARQAQASIQSSRLMQLNRFACMPSFMRRPIWRLLYRHTDILHADQ